MKQSRAVAAICECVLVLAAACAVSGYAQPPMGPMGGGSSINVKDFQAGRQLAKLTKKYKLTDAEKEKIRPILAEQEAQIHTLGDDTNLSDAEWTAAVRRVHSETAAKVKAEMTDEQASQYVKDEEKQAKRDAEDDQMQGPPDGGPPPGPPPGGGGGPPM